jgi:hypothetical protein
VSNGDSGSDQEQESYTEIIVTELGTNFNVDLRNIELTGEDRKAISSQIINVIFAHMKKARMKKGSPLGNGGDDAAAMEPIDNGGDDEYGDDCSDNHHFRSYKR